MSQKTAPSKKKIIFQVLDITWYVSYLLNILKGLNPSKAAGIDKLSGNFLNDGAHVLTRPMSLLSNLSKRLL